MTSRYFDILDEYDEDVAATGSATPKKRRNRGRGGMRKRTQAVLGLKDGDNPVEAVRALKRDAANVPGLERRIKGLRGELAEACRIIGCDHPDDLLPALRRQTARLECLERRLKLLEESRSQAPQ